MTDFAWSKLGVRVRGWVVPDSLNPAQPRAPFFSPHATQFFSATLSIISAQTGTVSMVGLLQSLQILACFDLHFNEVLSLGPASFLIIGKSLLRRVARHPGFSKGWRHVLEMAPLVGGSDPLLLYDLPESWLLSLCLTPVSLVAFLHPFPCFPLQTGWPPNSFPYLQPRSLSHRFLVFLPFPFKFSWGLDLAFLLSYALVWNDWYFG